MMHTDGISYEGDILDLAIAQKMIVRSGAWFRYGETHLGQGREKVRQYLKENPALTQELREKILAAGDSTAIAVAPTESGGGSGGGDDF
jgi:recombination protein RecA